MNKRKPQVAVAPQHQSIREQTLRSAIEAVCGSRDVAYGKPENNFDRIAAQWQAWLDSRFGKSGVVIDVGDVAAMLTLVKIGRLAGNIGHKDSWIDVAGYAACGAEVTEDEREHP